MWRVISSSFAPALLVFVLGGNAIAQQAVVMKDSTVVKCQKYEIKGNIYVLTMPDGKLQSLRADKVDADATAGYAAKMKQQAEAEALMKQQVAPATPATGGPSLTNDDLKKYQGIPMGDQSTVTAEQGKMPDRKDYEATGKKEETPPAPTPAPEKKGSDDGDKGK